MQDTTIDDLFASEINDELDRCLPGFPSGFRVCQAQIELIHVPTCKKIWEAHPNLSIINVVKGYVFDWFEMENFINRNFAI